MEATSHTFLQAANSPSPTLWGTHELPSDFMVEVSKQGTPWDLTGSPIRTPAVRMESVTCGGPSHKALAATLNPIVRKKRYSVPCLLRPWV